MALSICITLTLLTFFSLLVPLLVHLFLPLRPPPTTSITTFSSAAESSPISRTCYAFSILPDGSSAYRAGRFACLKSERCSFACPANPHPTSCVFSLTLRALLAMDADAAASSLCIVASADTKDERDYQIDVARCSSLEDCRFCCHLSRPVPIGLDADRPAQLGGRRFGPKEQDF